VMFDGLIGEGFDQTKYPNAAYLTRETDWFATGSLYDNANQRPDPTPDYTKATAVASGVAFMAYGYPHYASSNSGSEDCGSMNTFMVQDESCQTYVLVLIDKAGCGQGGYVKMDIATTGLDPADAAYLDPIAFQNDPHARNRKNSNGGLVPGLPDALDNYTWTPATQTGTAMMQWDACCNDGLVVGPLPYSRKWSVNFKVHASGSSGRTLDLFKIGTYDAVRNEVGFIESNIKKVTQHWGGLTYEAMECTSWCQQYTDCSACTLDDQCTFSAQHGGCVSADAYIYDYGCALPSQPPITKVMARNADAHLRESNLDGFDSGLLMRYAYDARLDMSCPCNTRYRYHATVYDATNMEPIYQVDNVPMRLNAEHTFVDIPHLDPSGSDILTHGSTYKIHSHLCIEQGTLKRDECSPVTIDTITYQIMPPPPPPAPPSTP